MLSVAIKRLAQLKSSWSAPDHR